MKNQLKGVRLPQSITKYYFDCIEQQIMTICYFWKGEFWKLFVTQHLEFNKNNITYVEDSIKYINDIIQNAEDYYGVTFHKMDNLYDLNFLNGEIYLAHFDVTQYPLSNDVDEEGIHCFLIYGETELGYLVNDNFYENDEFILEKQVYENGIRSLFLVKYNENKCKDLNIFNNVINNFSYSCFEAISQSYKYIISNKISNYNSADLMDTIRTISSYVNKNSTIVTELIIGNEYLEECSKILSMLANNIRKIMFSVLKVHLKYEITPEKILYNKILEIVDILKCEHRVKQEVLCIIQNTESIQKTLHKQLLDYLEVKDLDDNESVYGVHDKLSIIYLINYWEECNEINEIDYDEYSNCDTYRDFKLFIFKKILCKGLSF